MGKGIIAVGVSSLIIIVLFSIMTYLTATIEPPQLSPAKSVKSAQYEEFAEDTTKPVATHESSSDGRRQSEGIIFDDAGILPIVDTAQYGLDKMDIDVIDFYRSTKDPAHIYANKDRKVVPPLWPRVTHEVIVNPTMHKVMPPLWPTTSIIIDTSVSKNERTENSRTNSLTNVNNTNNSSVKVDKPMKRRSVSNYILDEDANSVILKILDYNGQPRIEIKLWSDYLAQTLKEKSKEMANENVSTLNMESDNNNSDHKSEESGKNTIITIMANDSIVVEESGGKNITELLDSIVLISKGDKYNNNTRNNITENLREPPIENPSDKNKLSQMLVNPSQSSEDRTNSSNFEITNNNTDTGTNIHRSLLNTLDSNKVIKKSSSSFNGNSPNNDKISISDIYPNNYTDLFIENDNDMVY